MVRRAHPTLIDENIWLNDRCSEDKSFILIKPGEKLKFPDEWSPLFPPKEGWKEFTDRFNKATETTGTITDPLILDLDGDGIETATLENGVYFDMDENGFAETMAWAGVDDGLIADDLDSDGVIDDGGELVRTFTDLLAYDSNSDNIVDAKNKIAKLAA